MEVADIHVWFLGHRGTFPFMALSTVQQRELFALADSGLGSTAVGRRMGLTPQQVNYYLRKRGVPKRSHSGKRVEGAVSDLQAPSVPQHSLAAQNALEGDSPKVDTSQLDLPATATDRNIEVVRAIRDDLQALPGDKLRAAIQLQKWLTGEDDQLNQPLSDDDYEQAIVTMLEGLGLDTFKRVTERCRF